MIGNSEMITQTISRPWVAVPNQNPISGAIARIGIAWSVTMYGYSARSINFDWLITTAKAIPSTMLIDRPIIAIFVVAHKALRMSEKFSQSRNPTVEHLVRRPQQEASLGARHPVRDRVPDAEHDDAHHERRQDHRRELTGLRG